MNTVTLDRRPYCRPQPRKSDVAGNGWLGTQVMQDRLRVLDEDLQRYQTALIGIDFDNAGQEAVVVMHTNFDHLEELQARLSTRVAPLKVQLRPGCHSPEQIAEALSVLEARAWHPKAHSTAVGWELDPSFSGFAVVIAQDAPEVAQALKARLGPLVRVKLGAPRRHSGGGG